MTTYSYAQLEAIWLEAAQGTAYDTTQWAQLMAAIAEAESSGNPNAENTTDNNGTQTSWGLWQISLGNHNEPASNWNNPVENATLAINKLETQGLSAWGTYDSGAYLAPLQANANVTPASSFPANTGSGGSSNIGTLLSNPLGSTASTTTSGIVSGLASSFGASSVQDALIRLGLVVLGGILIIVGITVMAGQKTLRATIDMAVPEAKAASNASSRAQE
jgi:hypothetical protein